MRLYMEPFGDRWGNMLGGRGAVYFELVEENVPTTVKTETIKMYEKTKTEAGERAARTLGKIVYTIDAEKKVEIQGFHIEDWNDKKKFPYRLLAFFVYQMRRKRAKSIVGGVYSTDTKTGEKLDVFKSNGFQVREMGAMAGHNEYHVEIEL